MSSRNTFFVKNPEAVKEFVFQKVAKISVLLKLFHFSPVLLQFQCTTFPPILRDLSFMLCLRVELKIELAAISIFLRKVRENSFYHGV